MILEIEYYKGDITLFGKRLDECSLCKLLNEAKHICRDFGDLADITDLKRSLRIRSLSGFTTAIRNCFTRRKDK